MWADWLHHPMPSLGGSQRFTAGDEIKNHPQVGILATSALEQGTKSEVVHTWADGLHHKCSHSGRWNQKWPTRGQIGYITPTVCEGPLCFVLGDKISSGRHVGTLAIIPAVFGGPKRCTKGYKIKSGPKVGGLATSPLSSWGNPNA